MSAIQYRLSPTNPNAHLYDVEIVIEHPSPEGQVVSLPNWIPGSYLIRDFSKNLIELSATDQHGASLSVVPLNKSSWQIEARKEPITISYQVYAWDLSVRGAHFDQSHAFFNATSTFLAIEGQRENTCDIELIASPYAQAEEWEVATTLPINSVDENGFGRYHAPNYKALLEYPVEMGNFHQIEFEACGIPHRMVLTGKIEFNAVDQTKLVEDLIQICGTELGLMGQPYPIEQYLFQVTVTEKDYGGLEHLDSTALICARGDLPYLNDIKRTEGYLQFLELCAHEYFHLWNVKRIQPKVYQEALLDEPVYTNQLWWFEGITSFYDAHFLYRADILSPQDYLNKLAQEMTRVYRMPGRFKQSVAESSFLSWTKFYQQDENAPNAIVSYYTKGSLLGLGLDLIIRIQTHNEKSLDDVLQILWLEYGEKGIGLQEGEIEKVCQDATGVDLTEFFERYLYGTEDLPFVEWFAHFGIDFTLRPATHIKDLGGKSEKTSFPVNLGANLSNTEHQTVKLTHVWQDKAACHAGLAAGDEIIALNGFKMANVTAIETFLTRHQDNEEISCHYFRRDELIETALLLQSPTSDRVVLDFAQTSAQETLTWLKN